MSLFQRPPAAFFDAGGFGIFTGPDPVADRVIGSGDVLFGTTVTTVFFSRGLNEDGSIAFAYTLADDHQGVALARTRISDPSAAGAA